MQERVCVRACTCVGMLANVTDKNAQQIAIQQGEIHAQKNKYNVALTLSTLHLKKNECDKNAEIQTEKKNTFRFMFILYLHPQ